MSAEIDTSYSSPPKGRAMHQPANQSVTPLLESHTKKKLLIAMSKLCSHGNSCNRQHSGCSINWSPMSPISNSESKAAHNLYLENRNGGINIIELIHDGVMPNSHAKGMINAAAQSNEDGPESQLCTVHLSQGLKRKAFNMQVSKDLTGKDPKGRKAFIQKLSMAMKRHR